MTHNIREEFEKRLDNSIKHNFTGGFGKEFLIDFVVSNHNTTLKEIEEEIQNMNTISKKRKNFDTRPLIIYVENLVNKDDIKQLIHQKLIK